jgi:hypothetical protein
MATVFVEQRKARGNSDVCGGGSDSSDGKLKTTYSVQIEILPA